MYYFYIYGKGEKMKYIALHALVLVTLVSCGLDGTPQPTRQQNRTTHLNNQMEIVCIDSVQYITYSDAHQYGLTVKFNKNGTVATCTN
jgi:hypothetical protein